MPSKKEASEKQQAAEGIALRITSKPDRYAEHGLSVSVPKDASTSETKTGQTATTQKES
jgi:hypothetical protein